MDAVKKLSIVIPCYNEEEMLPITINSLSKLLDNLVMEELIDKDSFLLFVNDGSSDETWTLISQFSKENRYVCGINLSGNVGHQNALLAGLSVAKEHSDMIVSIDADLQDDISVIKDMIEKYNEGNDIVYGVRNNRDSDSAFKRVTAQGFYRLMKLFGVRTVYNHADYRLMSKRSVDYLCQFRERNLFLRGLVPLLGYKTASVYYKRSERQAGESKYPLRKMLHLAVDGITSFSIVPVRMVLGLGVVFILVSLCILLYVLYSYCMDMVVPGWSSIMLSIWFCSGCLLVGMGIIGEYIGKIYLEVKDRPRYNIEDIILKNLK